MGDWFAAAGVFIVNVVLFPVTLIARFPPSGMPEVRPHLKAPGA